ncbi:MAG: response regulator [Verrucomicrobiia bacterium]|jgi:DNA-binding response OmpR family regulator
MIEPYTEGAFPVHLAIGDPLLSSLLELTLAEDGYQAVTFTSASKLWESFPSRHPRFIITEGRFADGFEAFNLCRLVRRDYPSPYVYIYIISRHHEMQEIEEALDAGANDYSIKPVNPLHIRTRVLVGMHWLAYINSTATPHPPPTP